MTDSWVELIYAEKVNLSASGEGKCSEARKQATSSIYIISIKRCSCVYIFCTLLLGSFWREGRLQRRRADAQAGDNLIPLNASLPISTSLIRLLRLEAEGANTHTVVYWNCHIELTEDSVDDRVSTGQSVTDYHSFSSKYYLSLTIGHRSSYWRQLFSINWT